MPSESFNEDQAYEVMDGVLEIEDCEDPDAVSDIINEELMQNPNNINYRNNYNYRDNDNNSVKEDNGLDNKIIICCLIIVLIFILALIF